MMDYEKEIIKTITSMLGRYSAYTVFADWIFFMAMSIQNPCSLIHDSVWREREQAYLERTKQYNVEELQKFTKMAAYLTLLFEKEPSDYLGDIYMKSGCGNKNTGQFFTPFHLSELCARLSLEKISEDEPIIINEPSCGGGGMIIACGKWLKEQGINYQRCMKVVAQDLDWNAIYMTYVQLSLMGIDAIVVQGDTLKSPDVLNAPKKCVFRTPKNMGVLL